MTWSFLYLAVALVGVILTAVIGVLRNNRQARSQHRHLVLPHPDHHGAFASQIAFLASTTLAGFGLAGLFSKTVLGLTARDSLSVAAAAGAVFALGSLVLFRHRRPRSAPRGRATVVREILRGGYGQVRVEQGGHTVILAAQNAGDETIPAGAEVEVMDLDRSVVRVRRLVAS